MENTGSGSPPARDIGRTPEIRDSRETVIKAFTKAYEVLEKTPESELSPKELRARNSINTAKEKTIDKGKDTFRNEFKNLETGGMLRLQEGIPVEELIEFLNKKEKTVAPDSTEQKEIIEWRSILARNSETMSMDATHRLGRTRQEAYFISIDDRATGSLDGDWREAEDVLARRLELHIPAASTPEPVPAPTEPTPPIEPTPAPAPTPEPIQSPSPEPTPPPGPVRNPRNLRPIAGGAFPNTLEDARTDFVIANRTVDIEKRAREIAENQLRAEMRRGSAWNPLNWPRKIGLRIGEEYHRQVFIERARQAMIANNNSYLDMDVVRNAVRNANQDIDKQRLAGKAKIEQIQTGVDLQGQTVKEIQGPLRTIVINELIMPVVNGTITNEAQMEQKLRDFVQAHKNDADQQVRDTVEDIFGTKSTKYGVDAEYFASNLLENGLSLKAHHMALDEIDRTVSVKFANARWAADTEANFNRVDKTIAWAQRHRLGVLANPAFIGAAFSLGTFFAMKLPGVGARATNVLTPSLVGAGAGALFAGLRRNYELKVDMAAHRTERAYNMQIPAEAHRREALERYTYEIASVRELLDGTDSTISRTQPRPELAGDPRGINELLKLDLAGGDPSQRLRNREALARRVAEIKTRLDFSSTEKVDLITFSESGEVEQGRLGLVKAIAQSRIALRNSGMSDTEISTMENGFTGAWKQRFTQNKEQQDRSFMWYRVRNAVTAGAFAGVAGFGAGLVTQEGLALIGRLAPSAHELPVIGAMFKPGETTVEKIIHGKNLSEAFGNVGFTKDVSKDLFNHPGKEDLGNGIAMTTRPDHTLYFQDSAGNLINTPNAQIDNQGHIFFAGKPDDLDPKLKPVFAEWDKPIVHEDPKFNVTKAKDLFNHPTNAKVGNDLTFRTSGIDAVSGNNHAASFLNDQGKLLDSPPMHMDTDGSILMSGPANDAPSEVNKFFADNNWHTDISHNPNYNLSEHLHSVITSGGHETITHGNTIIDIDGARKTFSLLDNPSRTTVYGTIDAQGNLLLDKNFPGNKGVDWSIIENRLQTEAWNLNTIKLQGTGNAIDQLFSNPDGLKAKGIIETDAFKKQWNFHVLRPDIVDATGMHTHNELTLHVGGEYHVLTDAGTIVRTGVGKPGELNFGGEIHGGLIDSHLMGVPPATDPVLNELIHKTPGGIKLSDMVAVVELTNDKQIMLPFDASGNAHLPPELFDPQTGDLRGGVIDVAAAVLQKPDGTIYSAHELLATGKIPDGAIVHSLASEKFVSGTLPPVGPTEKISLTPPNLTRFIPPPDQTFMELTPPEGPPPMIPIPFAPRYPLEPLEMPAYYYFDNPFPDGTRLRNIFRRGRIIPPIAGGAGSPSSGYNSTYVPPTDEQEAEQALAETKVAFDNTDHIYLIMDYSHIGDIVIATGYLNAVTDALRKTGKNTNITLVVNQAHGEIYDPLARPGLTILKVPLGQGVQKAQSSIDSSADTNPLVLEFNSMNRNNPTVTTNQTNGKNVTTVQNLLQLAIALYNNRTDGDGRYAHFVEELFSLTQDSLDKTAAQPMVELPPNKDNIYDQLATKFGIDKTKPQIAIVVEASGRSKRYPLDSWAQVITELSRVHPDYQFNIIYNPASTEPGFQEADIRSSLGVLGQSHLVGASLIEDAVLFEKQKLVLSNDTGLAHVAGALRNGPNVGMVFLPNQASPNVWISSKKQKAINVQDPLAVASQAEQLL